MSSLLRKEIVTLCGPLITNKQSRYPLGMMTPVSGFCSPDKSVQTLCL